MQSFMLIIALVLVVSSNAFAPSQICTSLTRSRHKGCRQSRMSNREEDESIVEEEVRLKILGDRRKQVRSALKAAESLRNFRLSKGKNTCF